MDFNLMEKLAIFKSVDEVIQLDEEITPGEVRFMDQLCESLGFEKAMIKEARRVDAAEALAVIGAMPNTQKQALARILNRAVNADGVVDEQEIRFIFRIFSAAGIELEI
ncbi:MAG: hypothetical protein RLZZ241_1752 [Bacteroidota bacterium]|jgi:uncharacterized tellurite resistance protein B-like protein